MTSQNNVVNTAIGFAAKSGKCALGAFAVERAAQRKEARVLLLDDMASENTVERFSRIAQREGIPMVRVAGLGLAAGKESAMVAAVLDEGLAKMITDSGDSETWKS